jgi:hypothetical protein
LHPMRGGILSIRLKVKERHKRVAQRAACARHRFLGGAERDRTADLLVANEALSQLSYSPPPETHEFDRLWALLRSKPTNEACDPNDLYECNRR